MADRRWVCAAVAATLVAVAGCSAGEGDDTGRTVGDGPLVADAGEGATISRPVRAGMRTNTLTFGTVLCSADSDAEIVIDDVRYDTAPELPEADAPHAEDVPSIGTWFRAVPPPDGDEDNTPIGGIRGGPQRLSGEVVPLDAGLPAPITRDCEDYYDRDRTFPIIEMLTVMTVDKRGSIARRTHVDYHVGDDQHTLTIAWEVGFCGTEVRDEDCRWL